jgi:hypothetical protein
VLAHVGQRLPDDPVLSLLGPLRGASAGDKVALLLLHLTVGPPLIPLLPRPAGAAQ